MFTSDNGYFLGEHRQRQGKIKPHEPSLRVPFVMAGPGIPHGERFDPVTTPGVTATIADLAGATSLMPYPEDGVSVASSLAGTTAGRSRSSPRAWSPAACSRRTRSSRRAGFHDPRNTIGVRTGRWKYVRYSDGDGELYDLDADPNELQNRISDPAYAQVRDRLDAVWRAYKDCSGAACRTPLPDRFQRTPRENETGTNTQSRGVREALRVLAVSGPDELDQPVGQRRIVR